MDMLAEKKPIVNGVGAAWFEDLSESFLDDCVDLGVAAVGCTANDTWTTRWRAWRIFSR